MHEPRFKGLRSELLRGGIAAAYVERTILELQDHHADLEADARAAGLTVEEAAAQARSLLGSEEALASAVLAHPELRSWVHRWPVAAGCLRAACSLMLIPAVPIVYCADRADVIARWGASVSLGLIMTSALLFLMQQLIGGTA